MTTRHRHEIKKIIARGRRITRPWPALVGDGSGTIEIPGQAGMWYVRPVGTQIPIAVFKGNAPRVENYPVWVGTDVYNKRWLRILGTNIDAMASGGNIVYINDVEPHASTHYLTGSDVVYITTRQVADLLLTLVSGMTVRIAGGFVVVGGQPVYVAASNIDLTSHIPAGQARWALIRANSSGTLSVQDGTAVDSFADLTTGNIPAVATGYAALWAVRLYDGQTAVNVGMATPDIYDLRFAPFATGALADHDHSGDAGDGGKLDWDNVWSDAVHDHSADADGGKLDWDNVWSDAVHDHSADAEGGVFDAANLGSGAATDGYVLTADGTGGAAWEQATGGGALTVKEADDSPSVNNVNTIIVTNGKLTDNGSGSVTLNLSGDAGSPDAATVTYSPAVNTDWDGNTDPGNVDDALDQLAERVDDLEGIGSNETHTSAWADRPAASKDGDLFLPNNGFVIQRDTGSAWVSWGPIFRFTIPVLSSFTWVNQETATATESGGGIYLYAPAASGDKIRALVKNAPATPYTITAAIIPQITSANYNQIGILFRQSSDGKICVLNCQNSNSLNISKFSSATSYNSSYGSVTLAFFSFPIIWLRIADNGTDRICSWSVDGQNFIQIHSVGRTDYLTADQIGFHANANNSTWPAAMTLLSWKQE